MKRVLILTSERTGTGHKASANAIENKLTQMGYDCKQLNCFSLMGKMGENMENSYIPLTTKHPYLWKVAHSFSQFFSNYFNLSIFSINSFEYLYHLNISFFLSLYFSILFCFLSSISKIIFS